jgi:osmotically-inducible protein OsmY
LTGTVRTEEQKKQASEIARELAGVREVKNQLYVNQQA